MKIEYFFCGAERIIRTVVFRAAKMRRESFARSHIMPETAENMGKQLFRGKTIGIHKSRHELIIMTVGIHNRDINAHHTSRESALKSFFVFR